MNNNIETVIEDAILIRKRLDYNPKTGKFIWKYRKDCWFDSRFAGKEAGTVMSIGYRTININFGNGNKQYLAHRLAWLYYHGVWPKDIIDHIDRNKLNNAIENLRDVCFAVNNSNTNKKLGKSGIKGVQQARDGRWTSMTAVNGKKVSFGLHDTIEEAAEAYRLGMDYLANGGSEDDSPIKQRLIGSSGERGVHRWKDDKWSVRLFIDGKWKQFGVFETIEEARKVYQEVVSLKPEPKRKPKPKKNARVGHAELLEKLFYDKDTGLFHWKQTVGGTKNESAGCSEAAGYRLLTVNRKRYNAHVLAIFYMTGCWPNGVVDHIDGDKTNNRYDNLRVVTKSQNALNKRHCGKTICRGIRMTRNKTKRWEAAITIKKVRHHIGTYDTREEAEHAWWEFVAKMGITDLISQPTSRSL